MEEVSTSSLSSILSFSSPSSSLSNSPPVSLCPYHSLSSFSLSHTPPPSSGGEHAPHRRGGGVEGGQIYKRSSGLQRQAAERHRQTHWLTWATYLCSERARVCVWMWPRVCDKDTVVTAVRWWHQDPPPEEGSVDDTHLWERWPLWMLFPGLLDLPEDSDRAADEFLLISSTHRCRNLRAEPQWVGERDAGCWEFYFV